MSQSQTSSASATPYPATGCGAVIPSEEVDRSCRYPILFLALSSTGWLLLATVLNFLATLKFHKPDILADMGWLTYGRVHPAGMNCLIYGFAIQAGLAVVLWVFADLGKT
jgi:cytochrome c oxidase cbb3-type subunit 1